MEEIKEMCYKGTRILLGDEKRRLINLMIDKLLAHDFEEIHIPIIQPQAIFDGRVGEENNNLMFNFQDRAQRDLCLAPEYTSIIQWLSHTTFKHRKNLRVFYVQECFRGEKPQAGRYRQFTQLGVEIINPTKDFVDFSIRLAEELISHSTKSYEVNRQVTRGLDYYKEGKGFEITCNELGAQKQVCGGGEYEGGIGFAIGIDRLLLLKNEKTNE